jgi:Flp pilus assembly pilin Flp
VVSLPRAARGSSLRVDLGAQNMFVAITADERGASGAEYAALLTILLAGTIAATMFLAGSIGGVVNGTAASMTSANSGPSSPPLESNPGNQGRSSATPGHQMQQQGSAGDAPGASGYTPGHQN